MKKHTRYKFLRKGYKSEHGNHTWKVGQWYEIDNEPKLCEQGFHCSKGIWQAFSYVQGEILAEVEVSGKSDKDDNKEAWQKMRIAKSYKWTNKDSVMFSIYAARLVLNNFEKEFPDDKRPREAIEAAERYASRPTTKNRNAAESAAEAAWSAAWSAQSAGSAAWSAAGSAAWSAESAAEAAWSAAWSVWSAAWSAESAGSAGSAAWSDIHRKLDKWMKTHVSELRVLKQIR
jgi:hypothetical protein